MQMKRLLPALVALGTIIGAGHVVAQKDVIWQSGMEIFAVRIGEYRDLTWYRKFKLGTAPFVNAGLLHRSAVAFLYPPDVVLSAAQSDNAGMFAAWLEGGFVGFAWQNEDGVYRVAPHGDYAWMWGEPDGINSAKFYDYVGDGFLITPASNVFGLEPSRTVVSWDAAIRLDEKPLWSKDPKTGQPFE